MTIRSLLRIAAAAGLLAGFTACGDDSNDTTSGTAVPSPTPSPTAAATMVVTINASSGDKSYTPNPVVVAAGQTVAWKNGDTTAHTATADNASFDTGTIQPGATSKAITFSTAGSIAYHCTIHPSMVGTVTVQ